MAASHILDSPLLRFERPWWQPFVSMAVVLFGILFLNWDLRPIILLFWWEVVVMVEAALIRAIFAMDNKPFSETIFQKILYVGGGLVLGLTFIALSMVITFNGISFENIGKSMRDVMAQTRMLSLAYLTGIILHFFLNGRYKTASPIGEIVSTYVHLLILLAILQALTVHLIPSYPQLNQAKWIAVAVVVVKFIVDLGFSNIAGSLRNISINDSE